LDLLAKELLMRKSRADRAQLTEGPVKGTLLRLTGPMVAGIIGMVMFNLVDTFYVGHLGTLELAALSFTFPVVLVIASIAMGLGIGTAAVLSRAIGEGDRHKVQRFATDGLLLSALIVTSVAVAGMVTIEPLFRQLGADEAIIPLIRQYMRIWYVGVPFVIIPMVGNNAIRATGDTKTPAAIMGVAVMVNIILDPLLIFGIGPFPRLELAGAALATVTARAITLTVALLVLSRREHMLTFEAPKLKEVLHSWKRILYIGIPAAGTNIIVPISIGVITRLVSEYGPESVAGFGVASRIEMFALTVVRALGTVIIPFAGQNLGAGKLQRITHGVRFSQIFAMLWGVVLFIIFLAAAQPIAGIFNKNPVVVDTTKLYLVIVSISYGAQGVFFLTTSALNGLNKPLPAAGISIIRMFVLYIPLALLVSGMFGLRGIFGAATFSNFFTAGIAVLWVNRVLKNIMKSG
jgi:putative MATE family efflux protein